MSDLYFATNILIRVVYIVAWSPKIVGHYLTFYISERGEDELECGKTAEKPCLSFNFVWSQIKHAPSFWSIVKSENDDATLESMWDQNRATFKEYVNEIKNNLTEILDDFDCENISTSDLNSICDGIQSKFLKSKSNSTGNLQTDHYLEMLQKSCENGEQIYTYELNQLCINILVKADIWSEEKLRDLVDRRSNEIYDQIKYGIISGLDKISFNLISDSDIIIDKMCLDTGSNNDTHYHISVTPKNHTPIEMNVKDSIISKFTFHVNANQISLRVQNCSFTETVFKIFSKKDSVNLPVTFNNCKFYGDVFDSVIQIGNAQIVSLLSCSFFDLQMVGLINIQKTRNFFTDEQAKFLSLLICEESQIEIQDISFTQISLSYSESCFIYSDKCNMTVSNISVQSNTLHTSTYATSQGIVMIHETRLFIEGISFGNNYIEMVSVFYTSNSILTFKYGSFDNNTGKLVSISFDSFGIIDSSEFLNNIGNNVLIPSPTYSNSLIEVTFGGMLVLENTRFRNGMRRAEAVVSCSSGSFINVVNSTFMDNLITSVSLNDCNARVLSSTFVNNQRSEDGIVDVSNAEFVLMDSTLSNNNMISGHLLSISKSNANITRTVFSHNTLSGPYGVLHIGTQKLTLYVTECTFEYNIAQEDGGMIQLQKKSAIVFFNCIFSNNHAYTGSIGSFVGTNSVLAQCFFKNNSASQNGGILSSKESVITVKNCTVLGNKAAGNAGVFYITYHSFFLIEDTLFQNNSCVVEGGVIKAYRNNTITIINSSFTNNKAIASNAGTILLENECSLMTENCTFLDNVAASKGGTILVLDHSQYQDTGSHFIGNTASDVGWY